MSNPVFNRSPAFRAGAVPPAAQAPGQGGQYGPGYGYQAAPTAADLNAAYAQPYAGPAQTGRLTYDDVLIKSVGVFAVLLVGATIGWTLTPMIFAILPLAAVLGIVFGLINAFRRNPSPVLIILYAVFEGVFVGGISLVFEISWPGVVMQAVIGTLAVFGVVLALFASGKVRASRRATKIWFAAMFGYLLFSLINGILMWTGVLNDGFGMRSQEVAGIPLGLIIGILVVILAAYSFVMDFDQIKVGVERGAPAKFAWTCAFGLLVTLVWLYLELLRLLAILRR
jgi:uncharacterized YccA/Bax inhibitor family protein